LCSTGSDRDGPEAKARLLAELTGKDRSRFADQRDFVPGFEDRWPVGGRRSTSAPPSRISVATNDQARATATGGAFDASVGRSRESQSGRNLTARSAHPPLKCMYGIVVPCRTSTPRSVHHHT
jgi:hypothetical protein